MFKVYFKQAIQILNQNKFISIVTIVGTALAIMMIMAIIVSYEIKTLSAGPEPNRYRTLYVSQQLEITPNEHGSNRNGGNVKFNMAKETLLTLKTPELVSMTNNSGNENPYTPANREGDDNIILIFFRQCDFNYWKIMSFDFLEGVPFSQEEFESGIKVAVLSETTAKKLFRGESAVGQNIEINFNTYRVCGIVKDVSPVYTDAFSDIWVPYTSSSFAHGKVLIMAHSTNDFPDIAEEIREAEKRINITQAPATINFIGPDTRWTSQIKGFNIFEPGDKDKVIKRENRKLIFIVSVLLLVPAINLSGFSLSRVKKRIAEIGIRKAFGAKRHTILLQILYENMITSLIGGLLGLLLSYMIILNFKNWMLGIPDDAYLPISTLVSPFVWLAVFTACFLLNLLSAGIPAYIASKTSIVDSLTQNYN